MVYCLCSFFVTDTNSACLCQSLIAWDTVTYTKSIMYSLLIYSILWIHKHHYNTLNILIIYNLWAFLMADHCNFYVFQNKTRLKTPCLVHSIFSSYITQHYSKIGIRWFRNVDCYKAGGRCQAAQIFCRESGPDTAEDNEIKQQSIRQ